ncbi:MAG TPA: hypothetical protein VHK47_11390 [Polyangia bacterium]|nr:hypothetical protein [Polyangia bacterium]
MPSERELFLSEIGHDEEAHATPASPTDAGRKRALAANRSGDVLSDVEACGWWWCSEPDQTNPPWAELRQAGRVLRDGGIDLWSLEVSWVAARCRNAERLASELSGLEALDSALRDLVALDGNSEHFRSKWLLEMAPWLEAARQFERHGPSGRGRPRKVHFRAALEEAASYGWSADHVAAIFKLAGISKDSFESLRRSIGELDRNRRTKSELKG